MSILDSISVFGLNKLGLELALQCALTVEEWFPGCCNFALECGIDSVHSYQFNGGKRSKKYSRQWYWWQKSNGVCPKEGNPVAEGKTYCQECLDKKKESDRRRYARIRAKRSDINQVKLLNINP